jgi:hypothetical protein
MNLVIKKGDQRKKITDVAWDLMGSNKNGWEIVSDSTQTVSNEVKSDPPSTGDKKPDPPVKPQTVSNEVANNNSTQTVSNEASSQEAKNTSPAITEEEQPVKASEEFKLIAEELTSGPIKDFLDMNQVSYRSNAKKSDLIDILAWHLKNDVESLKTEFGL